MGEEPGYPRSPPAVTALACQLAQGAHAASLFGARAVAQLHLRWRCTGGCAVMGVQ